MNPPADTERDDAGSYRKSYAAALRLLARREHSVLELRHKLCSRKLPAELVDSLLEELVGQGLLSDRRFTEAYVRGRYQRGYGPVRIQAELRERGIDDSLMADSLAELSRQWISAAVRERRKRFGQACPHEYRERARQMRFLQQRGFTGDQIREVFDSL